MTLLVKSQAVAQHAAEDIVVYKMIVPFTKIPKSYHGKACIAVIHGTTVEGKLSFRSNGFTYICNNVKSGSHALEMFGYNFSWYVESSVTSIKVNGKELLNNKHFKTLYRDFEVKIGKTYKSVLIRKGNMVNEGLHSYKKIPKLHPFSRSNIAKCIIPKGALYYEGTFGDKESYASTQLKYIEIIKKNL